MATSSNDGKIPVQIPLFPEGVLTADMGHLKMVYIRKQQSKKLEVLEELIEYARIKDRLDIYVHVPIVERQVLDLVQLYQSVVSRGGAETVSSEKLWPQIADDLGLKEVTPLKLVGYYLKYLMPFEQERIFGKTVKSLSHDFTASSPKVTAKAAAPAKAAVSTSTPKPPPKAPVENNSKPPATVKKPSVDDISHLHRVSGPLKAIESSSATTTVTQVKSAESIPMTPVCLSSKQIRFVLQRRSEYQSIILALDSGLKNHVAWAINQLTILSYGPVREGEPEFLIAQLPGLLDALYRQLESFDLLVEYDPRFNRGGLFNLSPGMGERHILDERALLVLSILRNFSMSLQNEMPIAQHESIPQLLAYLLNSTNSEIAGHAFDIISNIVRHLGTRILDPMNTFPSNEGYGYSHLRVGLSKSQELMTTHIMNYIVEKIWSQDRVLVLRCLQTLTGLSESVKKTPLFENANVSLYTRLVELLSCRMEGHTSLRQNDRLTKEEISRWPAPWEESLSAGHSMGMVLGSRLNILKSYKPDDNLDHEVRDAALEVIYYLSEHSDGVRLILARENGCLEKLAAVLCSRIGRAEAPRMAVGALANISMNRKTFPYFLPIERSLVPIAASEPHLSELLSNVLADVYGMQSLEAS